MRIGIDIGGAFTDLVGYDEKTGKIIWIKSETTPDDPSIGVLSALDRSGIDLSEVEMILHGQTVVINSIITRCGAKVGLLTTLGHRDVLILQRANRRDIYNFTYKKPESYVPRYLTYEVKERIGSDGSELEPLSKSDIKHITERIVNEHIDSICISFLNSYINPAHEKEAKELVVQELKREGKENIEITLSHEITREWGEYERTNTAVMNAYVKPKMKEYLTKLESAINVRNFSGKYFSILSNGGISSFDFVKDYPIFSIESGPVAGIVGGIEIGRLLNEKNIIVLDGGSTTTKASLIENLLPKVGSEYYVGRDKFNSGYPVKVPVIEIEEIGNGGTSIAWIDEIGNLKVGPNAAGAYPGPACYGKGGKDPTVTDAYIVNGLINPNYLLGGEMKLFRNLAVSTIKEKIADYYGISVNDAADGIIKLANENAANSIRIVSVQKGYDPRDFSLIAHGGAGPMFAPFIALDLAIGKIIIPTIPPGVFSAWGMLLTDIRHDVIATNVMKFEAGNLDKINGTFDELEEKLMRIFKEEEKMETDNMVIMHYGDMRYKGQEHTVKVPLNIHRIDERNFTHYLEVFHQYHEKEYSFRLNTSPVEIVNFHVVGIKYVKKPSISEIKNEGFSFDDAINENRKVYIDGEEFTIPVFDRKKIPSEKKYSGLAIIEDPTSTVLVLKNQNFVKDRYGNIIITNGGR
ncbi:MAG: hydantoinase/oxoprolinase family protein [Thermoplasmata archaeon]